MANHSREPELRTIGALARAVNRSIDWCRDKSDRGQIPHIRDSDGRRLYDADAVDAALRLLRKRP
jgi:hypothetical protein